MSVAVGFSPAASGLVPQPTSDAAQNGASGGDDLFAALLALLGSSLQSAKSGIDPSGLGATASDASQALAPLLSLAQIAASSDKAADGGKSLMGSLTDALTALGDALDKGEVPDSDDADKLSDLVDALSAILVAVPPALASDTSAAPVEGEAGGVSGAMPAPTSADAPAPGTPQPSASDIDPVLGKFADLLNELGDRLSGTSPELARKLETLSTQLDGKGLSADLLTSLGVSDDVAADIARLAQRLEGAKSPVQTTGPQEIATPSLAPPSLGSADAGADGGGKQTASAQDGDIRLDASSSAPKSEPDATARKAETAEASGTTKPVEAAAQARDDKAKADDGLGATAAAPSSVAPAQPAAQARMAQTAYQSTAQINIPQVAFELAHHIEAGTRRFQIRLDPPELGRIDVRLDMDAGGSVTARMTVERSETLDLMQRDQRFLQQALQQAGIDSSRTSLEFSLKQNPFARDGSGFANSGQGQGGHGGQPGTPGAGRVDIDSLTPISATASYRGTATAGGVNLFV